jgi:predicted nuclease of predicted toxin-antitoxin system
VKFLVDNQLPSALARFLASRGVDCLHVLDIDMGAATDVAIWEYAAGTIVLLSARMRISCTWRRFRRRKQS